MKGIARSKRASHLPNNKWLVQGIVHSKTAIEVRGELHSLNIHKKYLLVRKYFLELGPVTCYMVRLHSVDLSVSHKKKSVEDFSACFICSRVSLIR